MKVWYLLHWPAAKSLMSLQIHQVHAQIQRGDPNDLENYVKVMKI